MFITLAFQNPDDIAIYIALFAVLAVFGFIVILPIYFIESSFYKKHIGTIKESLEELKELEEMDRHAD